MKKYSLGLYEKAMPQNLSWRDKLIAAKNSNYDFVEISIDASEDKIKRVYMNDNERIALIKDMYEVKIPIGTMNVSALTKYAIGDDNPDICDKGMMILEKALELAADIGVRIVMIPGYDIYYGKSTYTTQQRFIKNLETVTKKAASLGVIIGMETMENQFMNTVWKAMYYVNMINSPYLGVYPDSGNMKNAALLQNSEEKQDLESGKGHIYALHLKETLPGKFREVPYGDGHVDFTKIISKAWEIGIRKYVTEFWYTGKVDWQNDLLYANNMMRKILDNQ